MSKIDAKAFLKQVMENESLRNEIAGSNYYGVDPDACYFFKNGWEGRIAAAAGGPFEAYKRRL